MNFAEQTIQDAIDDGHGFIVLGPRNCIGCKRVSLRRRR